MARWLIGVAAVALATGSWRGSGRAPTEPTSARAPMLLVRVLEDASRQPLPNAEVIDLGAGVSRFTNADGETRLPWPPAGRLRLRVRQLGFQFVEREVSRSAAPDVMLDTATVTLAHVRPKGIRLRSSCRPSR